MFSCVLVTLQHGVQGQVWYLVVSISRSLPSTGFIQASKSKIQGLLKASPTVFKDLKLMKNTDQSVKILQKC